MATATFNPSAIGTNTKYASVTTNYPLTNLVDSPATQTGKYAGINLTTGSNAQSWFYVRFDCSEIPQNVDITNISCSVKVYNSSNAINRTSTRKLTLYNTGHSLSSTRVSNQTSVGYKEIASGSITSSGSTTINLENTSVVLERSDLDNICFEAFYTRNTTNTTTSTQVYIMGATLTVEYEEKTSPTPDPSGGDGEYSYTGSYVQTTLIAGKYRLQCWGAQGGSYNTYYGGKGGYSEGILTLTEDTVAYIYVGGQPETNSSSRAVTSGGFNGGGNGQNRYYSSVYTYGQGGGGASDIRIGGNTLYHRIIVAGGGGGSASNSADSTSSAKWGGGETGGPGGASSSASYIAGQTAGTTSGYYVAGEFGEGASAYTSRINYQHGSGGGGGGWYGGYAYNYSTDSNATLQTYNGGGSGFVWKSGASVPDGYKVDSSLYLTDAFTRGGNTSFESTSGSSETGHSGNGYVKITWIEPDDWYTIDKMEGQGDDVITVVISPTGSSYERSKTFTVTTAGGVSKEFSFTRTGK